MLLSTKIMLLSHTSCYYQQKSCYYQSPHAIIHKTYAIILQLVLLSDISTTHVITKHIMLLSDTSCYYQHLNLLSSQFISYYYSTVQPPLIVAQLEERSLITRKGPGSSPGLVSVISGYIVFGLNTIFAQKIIFHAVRDVSCHKAIIIFKITVFENAKRFFS